MPDPKIVGVIEEGLVPDADGALQRANAFMRSNGMNTIAGNEVSQQTIDAVKEATFGRDETYNGNNSGFVGYYLEPGAKYVTPQLTPLRNMTPRYPGPGIDI